MKEARKIITCEQAVLAAKAIGRACTAVEIAAHIGGTDSRAVATAMRQACADGRVTLNYRARLKKDCGAYRFVRLKAKPPKPSP